MRFLKPVYQRDLAHGRNDIQLKRLIKRHEGAPVPLYVRQRDGGSVLVHRSTRKRGYWQATFFDEEMDPYADSESRDWAGLLNHIHGWDIDWRTAQVATPEMVPNAGNIEALRQMAEYAEEATLEDFADYYPATASGEMAEQLEDPRVAADAYRGQDVTWLGTDGRMVRVPPEYARHIEGNIFDPSKLAAVVAGVQHAAGPVVFVAPYGQASKVDLLTIKESLEYAEDEGLDRPLTTGDEQLDDFLVDPDAWLGDFGEPGDEDYDDAKAEMEARVKEAVELDEGDLGGWVFTFRDGNHRAFGALIAGEPFVWMILADNDYQDLREQAKAGKWRTPEAAELWAMLE